MNDIVKNLEADSAVYKTLLESTKAIPWKIDWSTLKFAYVGPQIESLLGWSPSSWVSVEDWAARMHPEDRACDVVHVVRNERGDVEALIGFMFDISERKKTEEKLITLQKELEDLSFKDGLTGVANRRMFDSTMEVAWADARRQQHPLSLILLDIDYFKQYNDHYGHIQGDDCLKRVGKILGIATRPRDFIARFGGEEFVLILPDTNAASATTVAERCRSLILKEQIPHEKSQVSQFLTVSLGMGTIIPAHEDEPTGFIEKVDRLLYQAKQNGHNRIC